MGREEVKTVYKNKSNHSMLYRILNAMLGTITFVAIYKIWLDDDNNYLYIFLAMLLSGILVSWTLRICCGYYETNMTIQHSIKNLINVLIYVTLVWGGIISWLFEAVPEIWMLILILMMTKLFVFLVSDYFADKMTFGG